MSFLWVTFPKNRINAVDCGSEPLGVSAWALPARRCFTSGRSFIYTLLDLVLASFFYFCYPAIPSIIHGSPPLRIQLCQLRPPRLRGSKEAEKFMATKPGTKWHVLCTKTRCHRSRSCCWFWTPPPVAIPTWLPLLVVLPPTPHSHSPVSPRTPSLDEHRLLSSIVD